MVAGHSYGGSVMSEAADGAPGVAALVYVASFNLEVGESTAELAAKFPGGELGAALDPVPFPIVGAEPGTDLYIQQDRFRDVFAADVAPEIAELMAATQRPIAASALEDTATKAAWKSIPSWTMVTTQDLAIPAESMRFMAARAGSTTVEIDASHAVTVSQPDAVADLIDSAARATAATRSRRGRRLRAEPGRDRAARDERLRRPAGGGVPVRTPPAFGLIGSEDARRRRRTP